MMWLDVFDAMCLFVLTKSMAGVIEPCAFVHPILILSLSDAVCFIIQAFTYVLGINPSYKEKSGALLESAFSPELVKMRQPVPMNVVGHELRLIFEVKGPTLLQELLGADLKVLTNQHVQVCILAHEEFYLFIDTAQAV